MRILYDHQIFQWQRVGGISNSFVNLIKNLPPDADYLLGIKDGDNIHLRESGLVPINHFLSEQNFISRRYFWGQGHLYRLFSNIFPSINSREVNEQYAISLLKNGQYDVFHPTFFEDYFLPYLNGKPFVLTVHAMIPEKFNFNDPLQRINKKKLTEEASHIIAVSNNTKEDLMDLLHVPESKITVIYHGMSNIAPIKEMYVDAKQYILFVGQRGGYKNFIPMVESLVPVLKRHQEMKILCTGSDFTKTERDLFRRYDIVNQMIHLRPSDAELRYLYTKAVCFVFPSLYEGFGIPILEAWAGGCPVLLNRKSCFPEIAQDAAIYFTLDDKYTDLTETMERFLQMTRAERQQLLERQNRRLLDFSWKKSAEQLMEVYKNVI